MVDLRFHAVVLSLLGIGVLDGLRVGSDITGGHKLLIRQRAVIHDTEFAVGIDISVLALDGPVRQAALFPEDLGWAVLTSVVAEGVGSLTVDKVTIEEGDDEDLDL